MREALLSQVRFFCWIFYFWKDTISKISYNLFAASRAQTYQRIMSSRDSYTLDVNADYVQLFSVIQICVIVVSGIVQTWFIKKLFKMKSYGGHWLWRFTNKFYGYVIRLDFDLCLINFN